jgi:hypothetical protein
VAHQDAVRGDFRLAHSWKDPNPADSRPVGTLHSIAYRTRWGWSQSVALIAVHGISADEAFDRLARRSQEANIKVKTTSPASSLPRFRENRRQKECRYPEPRGGS